MADRTRPTIVLVQTQAEVRAEINERLATAGQGYPYPESVFTEVVMQHMADVGMTYDFEVCHYAPVLETGRLRLSGFALSDDQEQLDLFVSLYAGVDAIQAIPDSETKTAAEQCIRFLSKCASGALLAQLEESHEAIEGRDLHRHDGSCRRGIVNGAAEFAQSDAEPDESELYADVLLGA
jgi:hypothetical protein